MTENEIQKLENLLTFYLPKCEVHLDPPAKGTGSWFLDTRSDGHHVAVEWRPGKGFGMTSNPGAGFGEGPEEVYPDFESAARRVLELLLFRARTVPPAAVRLRELRRLRGVSQQKLARRLRKGQASISKIENRGCDIRVRTLDRVVRALG